MTYDEVADKDLHDLCRNACLASEKPLKEIDQDMTHGRTDERTVQGHLGNSRSEVIAIFVSVLSDPRSQQLLQTRQCARCEHLRSKGVRL